MSGCLECLILWRDALNSKHRAARPPTCWALPLRPGRQTAEDSLGARAALALAFRFGVGFGGGDGVSLVLILSRKRCLAQEPIALAMTAAPNPTTLSHVFLCGA